MMSVLGHVADALIGAAPFVILVIVAYVVGKNL